MFENKVNGKQKSSGGGGSGSNNSSTNTIKNIFHNKLSSSSSSTSSTSSTGYEYRNLPINPFEETNKFRLEQSVLSPNLFHVANTSTPERDTKCLWNIDQQAVLYPADIPTDESSLIAQYIYDHKLNKQVSAAVEAFWTQNKIIIESPLASSNQTNLFKTKFGHTGASSSSSSKTTNYKKTNSISVNSPLSIDLKNNFNNHQSSSTRAPSASSNLIKNIHNNNLNSAKKTFSNKKDQSCQTIFSLPVNFDLNKIPELRQYFLINLDIDSEIDAQLNNSIRKKLFDKDSDDLSSSTTTTTATTATTANSYKKNKLLVEYSNSPVRQSIFNDSPSQLPRPEIPDNLGSSNRIPVNKPKLKTLASSSSSNDDLWHDSFDIDDDFEDENHKLHDLDDDIDQFANSSPKSKDKFSNILHDIGDYDNINNNNSDTDNDSVFLSNNRHKTPPDLSPLFPVSISSLASNQPKPQSGHFYFQPNPENTPSHQSCSLSAKKKNEKLLSSPNLSPIRQQSISSPSATGGSAQKPEIQNVEYDNKQNISFSEEIVGHQHDNHYKREEFFTKNLYHDLNEDNDELINNTYKDNNGNLLPVDSSIITAANTTTTSMNKNKNQTDEEDQCQHNLTLHNNMHANNNTKMKINSIIETTTNTFNQDSHDTGYQTTSANCGANGSSSNSSNSNSAQSSANPSMMIMDTTANYKQIQHNFNSIPSSSSMIINPKSNSIFENMFINFQVVGNVTTNTITSTPMSLGEDEIMNPPNTGETSNTAYKFIPSFPHQPGMITSTEYISEIVQPHSDLFLNTNKLIKNNISSTESNNLYKRPLNIDLKKSFNNSKSYATNTTSSTDDKKTNNTKFKKSSSISLENIQPVESSTPEKFKSNLSQLKLKTNEPLKSNRKSDETNYKTSPSKTRLNKSNRLNKGANVSFSKNISSSNLMNSQSIINKSSEDVNMSIGNGSYINKSTDNLDSQNINKSNNILKSIELTNLTNYQSQLMIKKYELDSSYMDHSILMKNKISPSEYARSVLEKAKHDLNDSIKYTKSNENTNFQF